MLCCNHCGWRPLLGSPMESWMALMLTLFEDALLPFELLHWDHYAAYYRAYCMHTETIHMPFYNKNYKTSIWQIQVCIWQSILFECFGMARYTRYVFGLAQCGMFWLDQAQQLQDTPRNTHGADGTEGANDVLKAGLRSTSNCFGRVNSDPQTAEQQMRQMAWKRHEFRERNPKLNTIVQQKKALTRQRKRDLLLFRNSDDLRVHFARKHVDGPPEDLCLVNKVNQSDLRHALNVLPDSDSLLMQELQNMQEQISDDEDPPDGRDELKSDSDSDSEEKDSQCTFECRTLQAVHVAAANQSSNRNTNSNHASNLHSDDRGHWRNMHLDTQQPRRIFFGLRDIVLEGYWLQAHSQHSFGNHHRVKMEWKWHDVYALQIVVPDENQSGNCCIYMKFTCAPTRSHYHGNNADWTAAVNSPTSMDLAVLTQGKFRFTLPNNQRQDLLIMLRKHCSLLTDHDHGAEAFVILPIDFDEDEKNQALARYTAHGQLPILGNHQRLNVRIRATLRGNEDGDYRYCANCFKPIGKYQTHARCTGTPTSFYAETKNLSNNIFGRLRGARLPRIPQQLTVTETTDPYRSPETIQSINVETAASIPRNSNRFALPSQYVLQSNYRWWFPFAQQVHVRCRKHIAIHREKRMLACKEDEDWEAIAIKPRTLIKHMQHAMQHVIQHATTKEKKKFVAWSQNAVGRQIVKRNMFRAVSSIWLLCREYERECRESNPTRSPQRRHGQRVLFWTTRVNLSKREYCCAQTFVAWGMDFQQEIESTLTGSGRWNFWQSL